MNEISEVLEVARALDMWKVTLPKEATSALQAWQAVSAAPPTSPIDDVRLAAARGELTAKNANQAVDGAALALVTAEKRQAVLRDLGPALAGLAAGHLRDHGDGLVEGLRPWWNKAVTLLTTAAAVIPTGTPAEVAITQGPDAVQAWADLAQAAATLDSLASARVRLSTVVGYGINSDPAVCMFVGPVRDLGPLEAILQRRDPRVQTERGGPWRLLLDAGCRLRLNTAAEARAVARGTKESDDDR